MYWCCGSPGCCQKIWILMLALVVESDLPGWSGSPSSGSPGIRTCTSGTFPASEAPGRVAPTRVAKSVYPDPSASLSYSVLSVPNLSDHIVDRSEFARYTASARYWDSFVALSDCA